MDIEPTQALSLVTRQRIALDMIDRGEPLPAVLAMLCHIVEAEAKSLVRASILLVDHANHCLRTGAGPGIPDRYHAAVDGIGIAPGVGTCASAAALNEIVETPDIANDPGWKGIAHLPLALGLVAAWSMPIVSPASRVLGTFGTYFTECRRPTPHEVDLVAVLARTAAMAIERCAGAPSDTRQDSPATTGMPEALSLR